MADKKRLIERPQEESFYVKNADAMRDKVIELLETWLHNHLVPTEKGEPND